MCRVSSSQQTEIQENCRSNQARRHEPHLPPANVSPVPRRSHVWSVVDAQTAPGTLPEIPVLFDSVSN